MCPNAADLTSYLQPYGASRIDLISELWHNCDDPPISSGLLPLITTSEIDRSRLNAMRAACFPEAT